MENLSVWVPGAETWGRFVFVYALYLLTGGVSKISEGVLAMTTRPLCLVRRTQHVVALVAELLQRGGLEVAMRGRDSASLLPLLRFISKNIAFKNGTYTRLVSEMTLALLHECEDWIVFQGNDKEVMELLKRICQVRPRRRVETHHAPACLVSCSVRNAGVLSSRDGDRGFPELTGNTSFVQTVLERVSFCLNTKFPFADGCLPYCL